MNVNVLGTKYMVLFDTLAENKKYERCDGYCEHHTKTLHIRKHTHDDLDYDDMTISDEDMRIYEQKFIRHELIHAFMYESGLDCNTHDIKGWARDEEMVDWIAIQMPKIMAAYDSIIKPKLTIEARYANSRKKEAFALDNNYERTTKQN